VYLKYDVMFIINQQRRYRVALHFTWCIVFMAFIWHGVYYYGISGTLYIMRWRFPKRNLFCYIIVCIGFHGYFKKIHLFKNNISTSVIFVVFFSIKSWHCVFLWFWCCSSSDILAHLQNNFESVPQAYLGNENDRKVSRRMHYFKNTYLHIHSRLLPGYSRPKSRRHNLLVYTRHRDTWIHYNRTQL
jgi:hypothetical protein